MAFASEDITSYYLMEAWRENKNIDFNFFVTHDIYISRDTSSDETIKRNLRERMKSARQFVSLGSFTPSEFDPEPWREGFCHRADPPDPVEAVGPHLAEIVDHDEDDVSVLCSS